MRGVYTRQPELPPTLTDERTMGPLAHRFHDDRPLQAFAFARPTWRGLAGQAAYLGLALLAALPAAGSAGARHTRPERKGRRSAESGHNRLAAARKGAFVQVNDDSGTPQAALRGGSPLAAAAQPVARALFWVLMLSLGLCAVLSSAADPALAQQGGGGAGIEQAIQAAQDWLASIMTTLGGLGMIASIGVKAVARTNENMHHAAHMGMTGSGIAIVAGLLLPDILSLLESFAGGGGGGN